MLKNLLAIILAGVIAASLCACRNEVPPESVDFPPESILQPEQEIKAGSTPKSSSEQEKGLSENDLPTVDMIKRIFIEPNGESLSTLSEKQREIIKTLLQPENWEEAADLDENAVYAVGAVFDIGGDGFISVNYSEEKTVIMIKWGENQKYEKIYYAPKEVALDAEMFREKFEFSQRIFSESPETPDDLKDYFDKYIKGSRFALNLGENYDEENYFIDHNVEWMFGFAMELAADGGTDFEDTAPYYPASLVEELITTYFLTDSDDIKTWGRKFYDPESETYCFEGGYGSAALPPVLTAVSDNGETIDFYLDIYCYADENMNEYCLEQSSVLTVKPESDGTWKYISNRIYFYKFFEEVK